MDSEAEQVMAPTLDDLFVWLGRRGSGAYGLAGVTQLQHALQSAALAAQQGLSREMILAALFHDVGHLIPDNDVDLAAQGIDDRHENASAALLMPLFGPAVADPVRLHVAAKRYLCAVEPDYRRSLAPDSERSLALQGGPMTPHEQRAFAAEPACDAAVALRRIDDQAKVPGLRVPGLASYRAMAEHLMGRLSA